MNAKNFTCPICDEGQLVPNVCMEKTIYKEKTLTINYESSTCSICGSEIVTPTQAQRNQAHILDEQRKIDGLLTSSEIKRIRETFNLTSTQAAELFGSDATAFSKYERGEATQSVTLDKLLRLVKEMPLAFERLRLIN
ncbi:transcriptional regulator, XRE family [Candidatus Thiomargarita nelsonii]|uniref:Transcriptional regulator, XRE family n=1 Tax=Candidatus Thiomargarita nelsonii TaxID=1003181 RepID=A0A176RVV0_9GAMM|nr:transcriptional regulator, XRE family [Candidatus Thiomargarita nelsonii]